MDAAGGLALFKQAVKREVMRKRLAVLVAARKKQLAERGQSVETFDSPFVPSAEHLGSLEMLDLLSDLNSRDVIMDLGCGDGRVLIDLALCCQRRSVHAQFIGVEIDEALVIKARKKAEEAGVSDLVRIVQSDLKSDECRRLIIDSKVTVIFLFLLPQLMPLVTRLLLQCSSEMSTLHCTHNPLRVISFVFPLRLEDTSVISLTKWPISHHSLFAMDERSMFTVKWVSPAITACLGIDEGCMLLPTKNDISQCKLIGDYGRMIWERRIIQRIRSSKKTKCSDESRLTFIIHPSKCADHSNEPDNNDDDSKDESLCCSSKKQKNKKTEEESYTFIQPSEIKVVKRESTRTGKTSVSDLYLYHFPFHHNSLGWEPPKSAYRFE